MQLAKTRRGSQQDQKASAGAGGGGGFGNINNDSSNSKNTAKPDFMESTPKLTPVPSEAESATSSCGHDVTPVPSAESEDSCFAPPESSHREVVTKETVPWDLGDEGEISVVSAPRRVGNNTGVVAVDDSDRFSQVSLGRSVVSNGVVDYDESIMSIARLDNFRSKTNQARAKANQEAGRGGGVGGSYPASAVMASSGVPKQISAEVHSPSNANETAQKATHSLRSTLIKASSWKPKSPARMIPPTTSGNKIGATASASKPSWLKRYNNIPVEEPQEEAPSSPANVRPPSPTRSSVSAYAASSPFMNHNLVVYSSTMSNKFSSSRSDVGVPTPGIRPSWKVSSPVIAKQTIGAAKQQQEEETAECPNSPTTEQAAEEEPVPTHIPKARDWSVKKQQAPVWTNRKSSSPASYQQNNLGSTARNDTIATKNTLSLSINNEIQKNFEASPAPRRSVASPRRHSSSPAPTWANAKESEQNNESATEKPPSTPTTKTWSAKKHTPAWMKKVPGAEETVEKPPTVPTTKTWSAKKQIPVWMKKEDDETDSKAATLSPRRSSTPSWIKPASSEKLVSPQPSRPSSWKARDAVSPATSKCINMPRSPSLKPGSPLRSAEKSKISGPSSGRKPSRQSMGSNGGPAISQRSASPSVAEMQKQIFQEKLGVMGKKFSPRRTAKVTCSPSPQVKELQKKIFSPEKDEAEAKASAAAGWWKRIPNPPEISPKNASEAPNWDSETSNNTGDHQDFTDVSPSPTMMSEPVLPSKNHWKQQEQESGSINVEAPAWLKDVASFHSAHTPTKLPTQPPVWQADSHEEPSVDAPQEDCNVQLAPNGNTPRGSPVPVNQGSFNSMKLNNSPSQDDSYGQQEETKSLIQMAVDSVLVIDYEQAIKHASAKSKSYDEDDSVHDSVTDALPKDLPLEFQQALTLADEHDRMVGKSRSTQSLEATASIIQAPLEEETTNAEPSEQASECEKIELPVEETKLAPQPVPQQSSTPRETLQECTLHSLEQERSASPRSDAVPQEDEPRGINAVSDSMPFAPPSPEQEKREEDKPQPRKDTPGQSDLSTSFCPSEGDIEYDENGFPCAPIVAGADDIFGDDDFHTADAFGSQPWDNSLQEEKKDASAVLDYWASDENTMEDASEWARRDPELDSVADVADSPVPTKTKNGIATVERVLEKLEEIPQINFGQGQVSQSNQQSQSPAKQASDAMWEMDRFAGVGTSARSGSYSPQALAHEDAAAWGLAPQAAKPDRREPIVLADPMWGNEQAIDATWGLPKSDPFSSTAGQLGFPAEANGQRGERDVFDPFGDEDEELFAEPTEDAFMPADSFAPPAPYDTYYKETIPLKPVSQDDEEMEGRALI